MMRSINPCALLFVCLFSFQSVHADTVDDFEGYANSPTLNAAWRPVDGPPSVTLETSIVHGGAKSMKVSGTFVSSVLFLVTNRLATAQDWSSATASTIHFRGMAGNPAAADITFQLATSTGTLIDQITVSGSPLTTSLWTTITLPLAGQAGLNDVQTIRLAIVPILPVESFTMYFDDWEVTLPSVSADITATETGGSTAVTEGGASDSVSVMLASMPANNVTVTPSFISTILSITPSPGVVTPAGWTSPLNFTVSAFDDNIIEGTHTGSLTFTTSSPDVSYDNLSTSNINVTVTDNESIVIPVMETPYQQGTNIRFYVDTENNQLYSVEIADDPLDPTWTKKIVNITGSGSTFNFPIPMSDLSGTIRMTTKPNPNP